jgi:hypothetical protein
MIKELNESSVARAVAEETAKRITRKVAADLKRMKVKLTGDDSELATTWDEICAQVQFERFISWDIYDETVRTIVAGYITELSQHEKVALWLQTDAALDCVSEDGRHQAPSPICEDNIIDYLKEKYVYQEANRWSNRRIRAYIERSNMRD